MKNTYKLIPEEHLRKHIICIRLSKIEKEWVKTCAKRNGISRSKAIRQVLFERIRTEKIADVDPDKFL